MKYQAVEDASFPYPPLSEDSDSFRLLRLLPSQETADIRCELYTASISENEDQYTALSYTWGSPTVKEVIVVNDHQFAVRQNLFNFLSSCLVRKDYPTLWIDAICINQDSIAERNHQVAIIGDIYKKAEQVYAWLGRGDSYSDWYLDYLFRHSAESLVRYLGRRGISIDKEIRFERGRASINSRSNWSRIWIVQEIMLAKKVTVICGYRGADWEELDHLEALVKSEEWHVDVEGLPNRFNVLQLSRRAARYVASQDLGDLLTQFGDMRCEVLQDHIYALLGLTEHLGSNERLRVDYAQPLEEIVRNVLRSITLKDPVRFVKHLSNILQLGSSASITVNMRLPLMCTVEAERTHYGHSSYKIWDFSKGWLPLKAVSKLKLDRNHGPFVESGSTGRLHLFYLDAPSKIVPNAIFSREFIIFVAVPETADGRIAFGPMDPEDFASDSIEAGVFIDPAYCSVTRCPIFFITRNTRHFVLRNATFYHNPRSYELYMRIDMKHLLDFLAALN